MGGLGDLHKPVFVRLATRPDGVFGHRRRDRKMNGEEARRRNLIGAKTGKEGAGLALGRHGQHVHHALLRPRPVLQVMKGGEGGDNLGGAGVGLEEAFGGPPVRLQLSGGIGALPQGAMPVPMLHMVAAMKQAKAPSGAGLRLPPAPRYGADSEGVIVGRGHLASEGAALGALGSVEAFGGGEHLAG